MRDAKNGTGLARPDHFDWSTELHDDIVSAKSAPTLMFASLGLNDAQDMPSPARIQDQVQARQS